MRCNKAKAEPTFLFECILKKKGKFYISQKSLDDIQYGYISGHVHFRPRQVEFFELLKTNNLMLVRISDDMSVIKKA